MVKKIKIKQQKPDKLLKSNLGNFLVILIIFSMTTAWIFSGWPRILKNPLIPPRIEKVLAGSQTYITPGTNVWTSPVGVTSVDVECWGGGGAGGGSTLNKDGAGGGGGGAYAKKTSISISGDTNYDVVVGAGGVAVSGAAGGNGGDSYFDAGSDVRAKAGTGGGEAISTGGVGGAGGTGSTGVTTYDGGAGGYGKNSNNGAGGPGGSSAGTASVGTSGATTWTSSTGMTAPAGGGDGGDGHAGPAGDGSPGVAPGGGGGGSSERPGGPGSTSIGGDGAVGKCILNWTGGVVVSVYAKDATVAYGTVPLSGSKSSTTTSDTQYIINNGTGTENFNVKGADTTDWDIATSSVGADIYKHLFTTTTGSYWQYVDNEYVILENGVATNGTSTVDFYFFMPSSDSSNYSEQSTTITIQAVEP